MRSPAAASERLCSTASQLPLTASKWQILFAWVSATWWLIRCAPQPPRRGAGASPAFQLVYTCAGPVPACSLCFLRRPGAGLSVTICGPSRRSLQLIYVCAPAYLVCTGAVTADQLIRATKGTVTACQSHVGRSSSGSLRMRSMILGSIGLLVTWWSKSVSRWSLLVQAAWSHLVICFMGASFVECVKVNSVCTLHYLKNLLTE